MTHVIRESEQDDCRIAPDRWTGRDGQCFVLRKVERADAEDLLMLARDLSTAALYFRFGRLGNDGLSYKHVMTICDFDPEWAAHWIVHFEGTTGLVPVANARYVVSPDRRQAEILLLVTDRWQKCGIGRRLLGRLTQSALSHGLSVLVARVLPSNRPMQAFLDKQGFEMLDRESGQPLVYVRKLV